MTNDLTDSILHSARAALHAAPPIGDDAYSRYCRELSRELTASWATVVSANREDVARAREAGLPPTLVNRLRLTDAHLAGMVELCAEVERELPGVAGAGEPVPAGDWGSRRRIPKPLGVTFMIYEARPTVTVDGALLPVVVGNASLLRGGKEIARTDAALAEVVGSALVAAGLPRDLVTVLRDPDRSLMKALLARPDAVDVLIPRGSPSLIEYCRSSSSIPLIASGGGVNHLYVHRSADLELAAEVTLDSKVPEPAGCTSVELVLVDREVAEEYLAVLRRLAEKRAVPFTVRLDPTVRPPGGPADPDGPWQTQPLRPHDVGREFLDPMVGVLAVRNTDEAAAHIKRHGSTHTEGIVAEDRAVAERFTRQVDAATIVVNGSLRLHDGPKLGMGSEISIATGRLHVRGPVTLGSLVSSTWVIEANGELRG